MSSPIHLNGPSTAVSPVRMPELAGEQRAGRGDFQQVLTDAIEKVEKFRRTANESVEKFLSGEEEDLHRVALATQQAELAFEFFLQARNKVKVPASALCKPDE